MALTRNTKPTGKKIVLELNEFDASRICGALSLYGESVIKSIAMLAMIGEGERASKLKDLMDPEIQKVRSIIDAMDAGGYSSEAFDVEFVTKQQENFERTASAVDFLMTDGKEGQPFPKEGNVVEFPAPFKKKDLH